MRALFVVGIAAFVVGVGMIYRPLSWIFSATLAVLLSFVLDRHEPSRPRQHPHETGLEGR